MNRRKFLSRAGFGVISTAAAAQAVAQTPALPEVRWRCASSFPKSLDTIYGGGETIAKRVAAITGGKFQIRVFGAGEIVPAFGTVDAVQQGTVECTHTASYYFVGKNKTFAFDTTLPFGMNQRQQNAWIYYGGGLELVRAFFRDFNIISFPAGNTGCQMGGWFRKEVRTVKDLKGVKMRIAGLGGEAMARLGAVPQQIAGGDIYPRSSAAPSTRRNGSAPTTTRSSASTRSRRTITTPAGGKPIRCTRSSSTSRNGRSCRRSTRPRSRPPATKPTST